jgi:hypothetical protein
MVSRKSRIEMSVGGVKKISLWKKAIIEGEEVWEEHPNLPKTFLPSYLKRGFVESPPKPEPKVEEVVEEVKEKPSTFSEAVASGTLTTDSSSLRVKKKVEQSKKV